ncbi:reverse transcriptase domain-containing protein [Tanacetum coccineum]
MQTRSSSKFVGEPSTNPTSTIPKRRNRRRSIQRVEPFSLVETPVVTMADQRTMAELLRAPTEGYAEAIVVPPIPAEHFELKHSLINLVTSKQFFGFEKEDPHAHIRYFNKITSTLKYKDVPETSIKLMLFPFSIDGPARIWLDKEPPRSILTWDDLVSKFINHFFPPSKTTNLRNEISNFQQRFDESFYEAWDRFKDLLRACPHHGFTELHQLDTFYNGLNPSDQDSLNSAAGGNLLERSAQDVLKIIENKSKVRNSRNKPIVSQVKASNVDSSEIASAVASAVGSSERAGVAGSFYSILENLVPIPSESEDFSDNESECDMPVCNDFMTFFNPLFDSDDDFFLSDEIDPHHFNAESDLIESLLNREISTVSCPKIDYLLEEFSGELTHINLIPPGINKVDFDPEEEIRLIEELLYDNSSPRPPEESNYEISDATIESSSPSPIPVEDSDSLMEEINLFLDPDDSIPSGIESDDYDSEGDILFLEELLSNDSLSLPETESFHFDHYDVPSSPRPPTKSPDDGIFFDFEPDTGVLTAKVVEDIFEHYVLMHKLLLTQSTLCPDIDTLLPFSSENEDKVFNPGILSSPLLSHQGKITSDFSESPMMISGGNIPFLEDFLIFHMGMRRLRLG